MPTDFNAECPDRPGVSVGEDLADQLMASAFRAEAAVKRIRDLAAMPGIGHHIAGALRDVANALVMKRPPTHYRPATPPVHLSECMLRMYPDDKGAHCTCTDWSPDQ